MATSKVKGKPAGSTTRKKSPARSATAPRKRSRNGAAKTAAIASSRESATRHPAPRVASRQTSAFGRAFWSRAGILSSLALGILILVLVNADRPVERPGNPYRSTGAPDHTAHKIETYTHPPATYSWRAVPRYHVPATPVPAYSVHPYYGPWPPAGFMQSPDHRKHNRKG